MENCVPGRGIQPTLSDEQNELINEAETELAFVRIEDWKPCTAPDVVIQAIEIRNQ